jgi:RimJ/RimL family protein N-acetyltransferase
VYLRAPVDADKEAAAAWLQGPFPINGPRAEELLKEEYRHSWWMRSGLLLVLVRRDGDVIVGGARVRSYDEFRRCTVELTLAPWESDADALRAEALRILVAWLRDELEAMVVSVTVAADQPDTIRAASELGMVHGVTLREWFARPAGRADGLVFEGLNPHWQVPDA